MIYAYSNLINTQALPVPLWKIILTCDQMQIADQMTIAANCQNANNFQA